MQAPPPPLLPLLRSRLQAELLTTVLLHPEQEWTLTELAKIAGASLATANGKSPVPNNRGADIATSGNTRLVKTVGFDMGGRDVLDQPAAVRSRQLVGELACKLWAIRPFRTDRAMGDAMPAGSADRKTTESDTADRLPTRTERYLIYAASLLVSIIVGLISYLVVSDLQQSIILGTITMLAFLVFENSALLLQLTRTVSTANARLDHLSESLAARDQFVESRDRLQGIGPSGAALAAKLEQIWSDSCDVPPVLLDLIGETLNSPAESLASRNLVHAGKDPALGTRLVSWFKRDAFATSIYPMDFWFTPWGQNYHQITCERMRNQSRTGGLRFRRVFIAKDENAADLTSGAYHDLIREQIDAGVEVRACLLSDLSSDLCVDFGLWDDALEVVLVANQRDRITKTYYRNFSEATARHRANQIWDRSTPFDDWIARIAAATSS